MSYREIIQLPYLRMRTHSNAQCLSPGLGDGGWRAADYPLSAEEARHFLTEIKNMQLADLETWLHCVSQSSLQEQFSLHQELASLDNFANRHEKREDAFKAARRKAQCTLLWQWHMESLWEELAELSRACSRTETTIPMNFDEQDFSLVPDTGGLSEDENLHISWETSTINAAFFLPEDIAILAVGEMAVELQERLEFADLHMAEEPFKIASGPIWKALGRSPQWAAQFRDEQIRNVFTIERCWLISSDR